MTYRVGRKGQVVIPKPLRDRHGIRPGDEVVIDDFQTGEITVSRARDHSSMRGVLKGSDWTLGDFEADRRSERKREDTKA